MDLKSNLEKSIYCTYFKNKSKKTPKVQFDFLTCALSQTQSHLKSIKSSQSKPIIHPKANPKSIKSHPSHMYRNHPKVNQK